jgi:hypothetical protein
MERGYIAGMIKNLEVDTATLKVTITGNALQIKGIDTLRSISKNKLIDLKVQDSLYRYTDKYLFGHSHDFKFDEITLIQLRNTGGYRLIRDQSVLDSIATFESNIEEINWQENYFLGLLTQSYELAGSIFDLNADVRFRAAPTSTPVMLPGSKDKIAIYYNKCALIFVSLNSLTRMLKHQLVYSTRLISYLKKEYNQQ